MTLFLYRGFELWLIPTGSVVAALGDYFTVEFLTKILGFVSGAGVVIALLLMTTTSSAGSYVANKQAEIVPAVPGGWLG